MYNCKKNGTTAKLYVGIIQEISTTAKKMAQLRNKMYNCKKKAQLRNTFIAVVHFLAILNYRTNSTFHFSFPFLLISTLPRHPATAVNKVATSRRRQPLLESRHVIFLLLLYSLAFLARVILLCTTYAIPDTPLSGGNPDFCRFFYGLRAVLIFSRRPKYIKNMKFWGKSCSRW